jgi:hypothetical protein
MGYVSNLVVTSFLVLIPVLSSNPTEIIVNDVPPVVRKAELAPTMPKVRRLPPEPTPELLALINSKAEQYNVSSDTMLKVISCESGFNERALGDAGYSRGLVQIHSKYHPTVTDAQAYDPEFAITFLAEKLSQGKGGLWTCWRNLAKSG